MAPRLSTAILRTQTDRRLVTLAREGSEPAFEALVERYRRPLQAYCRRLLLPSESAEDVVQQAFLATWQALGRGTDIADIRPWLFRTTHNTALNALRRSRYGSEELTDSLRGADAPEEDLERRIAVRQALAGLAELPELQREALLRTAVEGHSHEQVARELGLTDGAVRGLVYRARTTLRATATAIAPSPFIAWVAAAGTRTAPLSERVGELVAGGGSAGAAALLAKGSATVLTAGALAGGGAAVVDRASGDRPDPTPAARAAERPAETPARDPAPAPAAAIGGSEDESARRPSRANGRGGRGRGRGRGRGGDDDRRASSGPGSGRDDDDRRGGRENDDRDDDDRRDSRGPGSDGDDDDRDRDDSSGSGSSRDDDDRDRDDSSGPGSGGDDDPRDDSGGSGGSGGDDDPHDDSSGSGSGGDRVDEDRSGGDDPGGFDDSSGSGSGGDEPALDLGSRDSSGSGSADDPARDE